MSSTILQNAFSDLSALLFWPRCAYVNLQRSSQPIQQEIIIPTPIYREVDFYANMRRKRQWDLSVIIFPCFIHFVLQFIAVSPFVAILEPQQSFLSAITKSSNGSSGSNAKKNTILFFREGSDQKRIGGNDSPYPIWFIKNQKLWSKNVTPKYYEHVQYFGVT